MLAAMSALIEDYGRTSDGAAVQRITLEDAIRVTVLTIGAVLERIDVPDRAGRRVNVALGLQDDADGYASRSPHFGAVPGRYAGRIAGARFVLDGVEYRLPANDGPNCLHGGPRGFGRRVWTIEAADRRSVVLTYISEDGEAGFPGRLRTKLTYSVAGGTLQLRFEATTDRPTVLNLTNHSYFNLGGEGSGDVFDHVLQLEADAFLEADAQAIPTGVVRAVDGTPFDFRAPTAIGARIRVADPQILFGGGYDQCWVLRGSGMRRAAGLENAASGRTLEVWTDQPGLQVYTANKLTGALHGPAGRAYRSGDAVCLETQHFPDSPNRAEFPSTVLRPGDTFRSATDFVFGCHP
ncbi:MAG: galactose mutarotase [Acetobacteraceae bacterium]